MFPPTRNAKSSLVVGNGFGDFVVARGKVTHYVATNVAPPKPLAGGRSFTRMARSVAHPSKGIRPLPYAKTSSVVVYDQEVVENVDFFQRYTLLCQFNGFWPSLSDLHH